MFQIVGGIAFLWEGIEKGIYVRKSTGVTTIIIGVTVLVFLISSQFDNPYDLLALWFHKNEKFRLWQPVTTIFMHGGYTHLLFNMYALWAFGTPLAEIWGRHRFLFFYLVSGIGASLIYLLVNQFNYDKAMHALLDAGISAENIRSFLAADQPSYEFIPAAQSPLSAEELVEFFGIFNIPAVGASGAIYGVLVAFGMLYPNAKLALIFFPVPIPAKYFIPVLIGLDLFSGVTGLSIFGGGIAHFAHVGGALIGFLLMLYWKGRTRREDIV